MARLLLHDPRALPDARLWINTLSPGRSSVNDRIPWIPFTAKRWLEKQLGPQARVFEYGSGGSTLWLADRVGSLVSVEHDKAWYGTVADSMAASAVSNCVYRLLVPEAGNGTDAARYRSTKEEYSGLTFERYAKAIDGWPDGSFDVVLVDGRTRMACLRHAVPKVRPGGYLVLDNSERDEYREADSLLADWRRRDFYGLAPYRTYLWRLTAWEKPQTDASPDPVSPAQRDTALSAGTATQQPVGHVVRRYLPRSQTFIHTMLRSQERYRPTVLTGSTCNLEEFRFDRVVTLGADGVSTYRRFADHVAGKAARVGTGYDYRLVRAARQHGCQLLHAHFGPMACRVLPARDKLRIPLVTTFYGFDLALLQENPEWRGPYARLFAEGDLFFCEGPAMKLHLERLGCPAEKIRVVKIGVDLTRFPFAPRRRSGRLIVLQTGRLVEKKGVDLSIRAFAAARGQLGESELWIVGDGPQRAKLEALAGELEVTDAVRFLGDLSYADYAAALERAHVGIQPSRVAANGDTEGGAPTVLLEMQATGMPVVATRHADIPTVVASNHLPEEGDVEGISQALVRLAAASEAGWREQLDRGRQLVEAEHDARKVAARVESLYDELLT